MLLFDATHHHAKMSCFHDNADALRLDDALNGLGDLRRHSLLHLETPGEYLDETRQFTEADDLAVRDICDVHFAEEWQHVMFTLGEHLDVFHDHHLVVVDGKQCGT